MFRQLIRLTILLLTLAAAVSAQTPAKWSLSAADQQKTLKKGETANVDLKADIDDGWHLYALDQPPGGPIATTIKVTEGSPFEIAGKINAPAPTVKPDPNFPGADGKPLQTRSFQKSVAFSIPLK